MDLESPWEMVVCEYCYERIHRSQIEEHKTRVHAQVIEAEETIRRWTKRETQGWWVVVTWFALMALVVVVAWYLDVQDNRFYLGLMFSPFVILAIVTIFVLREPNEQREARKKAWKVVMGHPVKCDVCERMVPFNSYMRHLRSYHKEQYHFEWLKATAGILFLTIAAGGVVAIGLLLDNRWLPPEQTAELGVGWIVSLGLTVVWMYYFSHVGELKHIRKMRERWQARQFEPALKN